MRTYDNSKDELHLKSINSSRILTNTMLDFTDLFSRDALLYFLRIAILICGYVVIRPLIEACFRRVMTSQETVDKREKKMMQKQKPRQKSLADELLVDSDEAENAPDDDDDTSDRQEWGGTLRRRQKARFMEVWEEEQARLAEEEELRELEDILED
jgi:hypothetical protein